MTKFLNFLDYQVDNLDSQTDEPNILIRLLE